MTYAPFIRNVILVTNGQVPNWLNVSNPRLRLVTHKEIFEKPENLPTFNSNAIECQLSRIPGIAPCWFSLNDDFGFGRPVDLGDWMDLKTGAQKLNIGGLIAPAPQFINTNFEYDMSIGYSNWLLNKYYYPQDFNSGTTILNVRHKHQYEGHGARLMQQRTAKALYQKFHEEFLQTTRNRKRYGNDTVVSFLYTYFAMKEFNGTKSDYLFKHNSFKVFWGKPDKARQDVAAMLKEKPISWCLNDDAPPNGRSEKEMKDLNESIKILLEIMEEEFPLPSELEKVQPNEAVIPRTLEEWNYFYSPRPEPIPKPPKPEPCKAKEVVKVVEKTVENLTETYHTDSENYVENHMIVMMD